ncbi:C45 family autoproteolytic acyltransferase/hydrolase [Rapidithrix thailandica]|uniref:C45 family autoproteolytic acyltransferase/hydrolase n=1 Tax=Rapidithrix thailandica TaxID=413964 RepID=A0AAW9S6D2_9BACT
MEEHIVNLDLPVDKRWDFLRVYKEEMDALLECYLNDFRSAEYLFDSIHQYKQELVTFTYLEEIEFISSFSKFSTTEVLIANLYYDILKFYFGCTAFAVNHEDTILHARNLDWHTENNLLSRHSRIFNFQENGKTLFKTVGWAGFLGALSGVKPGKFSLTLNAVESDEPPEVAYPISFLLRDVLELSNSFQDAKEKLEKITIACDCLILLSGVTPDEKVVIERTPKRYATRGTQEDFIVVTNDYKTLGNNVLTDDSSLLQATSCGRYDRAIELLQRAKPESAGECLHLLQDDKVQMEITVQQMVFNNKTGDVTLVKANV